MSERNLVILEQAWCSPHGILEGPGRGSVSGLSGSICHHYHRVADGGYVLYKPDCSAADVLDSPMPNAELEPGNARRFDRSMVTGLTMVGMQLWDQAAGYSLTRAMLDGTYTGLDDVAPDVYAAWWHAHGAHVGRRAGNVIEYPDATGLILEPPDTDGREQMDPRWWRFENWTPLPPE